MRSVLLLIALISLPLVATAEQKPAAESGAMAFVVGVTNTPGIGGAYYVSPTGSLRANLAFDWNFSPASATFGFGLGYRHHFSAGEFRPFFEPGLQLGYARDLNASLYGGLGVEYFIVPRVSIAALAAVSINLPTGGSNGSLGLGSTGIEVSFFL